MPAASKRLMMLAKFAHRVGRRADRGNASTTIAFNSATLIGCSPSGKRGGYSSFDFVPRLATSSHLDYGLFPYLAWAAFFAIALLCSFVSLTSAGLTPRKPPDPLKPPETPEGDGGGILLTLVLRVGGIFPFARRDINDELCQFVNVLWALP